MSANPDALVRLVQEFCKAEPDAVNAGIYAAKGGYHNTRANHEAGRNGGRTSDYSIKLTADRRGPSDKAAATDITFRSAQRSDFRIIAKYTSRLINAMKKKDARLYHDGRPVIRECFGNSDTDRSVEGWTLHRTTDGASVAASSDSSHLWHLHISYHREFVENWEAVSGVLDVLLDRPSAPSPYVAFPGAAHFKLGAESNTIGRMNMRLRAEGHTAAPKSREFTAGSKQAYGNWQRKCGYTGADADGIPGKTSWDKLRVRKDGALPSLPAPAPKPAPKPEPTPAPEPKHEPVPEPQPVDTPAALAAELRALAARIERLS